MDVFTSSSVIAGQSGSGDDGDLPSLVERVRSGDPSSLERLLARVRSSVRIWAQKFTGDPDAAEDVTQEVLIGLERRVRKFDGASGFSTWLYAVTRNVALSSRRRDQRRLALVERRVRTGDSTVESPNQTDASALAALALRYFDALPKRQRQIFELVDVRGMSPAEAARQLGMEQVTVRGHLFKARRAIRTKMLARHEQLLKEYLS
jgi:RNA polymerase sigma-70 factor (ECF subfamily)